MTEILTGNWHLYPPSRPSNRDDWGQVSFLSTVVLVCLLDAESYQLLDSKGPRRTAMGVVVYHEPGRRSRHWTQNRPVPVWIPFLVMEYCDDNDNHGDYSNCSNNNSNDCRGRKTTHSPARRTIYLSCFYRFRIQTCLVIFEFRKVLAVHLMGPINVMLIHEWGTVRPYSSA